MFFDTSSFPFTEPLERQWEAIRREFEALDAQAFSAWPERRLYNYGWDVFGLHFFGKRYDENCQRCPVAASVVESIPGMTSAGFSVLAGGAYIKPHRGYTKAVLRLHLGLIVPEQCGLRVGSETRAWSEGKVLVFDDTNEHEAWNRSDERRVVLLVDFRR